MKLDIESTAREAGFLTTVLEPGSGHEPIKMIQPVSSTNISSELQRFAALLLEKAAQVCEGRESMDADWCAQDIRKMAAGMGE